MSRTAWNSDGDFKLYVSRKIDVRTAHIKFIVTIKKRNILKGFLTFFEKEKIKTRDKYAINSNVRDHKEPFEIPFTGTAIGCPPKKLTFLDC